MHKKHPWFCLKEETDKGSWISNVKKKPNKKKNQKTKNVGLCKKTIYMYPNRKSNLLVSLLTMDKTDLQDDENGTETHPKGNTTFS